MPQQSVAGPERGREVGAAGADRQGLQILEGGLPGILETGLPAPGRIGGDEGRLVAVVQGLEDTAGGLLGFLERRAVVAHLHAKRIVYDDGGG